MFNVIGSCTTGNLAYWDGKEFTKNEEGKKRYKVERSAIGVARKLKSKHPEIQFEVASEILGQSTRIIVVKEGSIYTALPKEWERLKTEGFSR